MNNYYVGQRVRLILLPSQLGTITKTSPQICVMWDNTNAEAATLPTEIEPINA